MGWTMGWCGWEANTAVFAVGMATSPERCSRQLGALPAKIVPA